jgi:hypothetical protein
MNNIGTVINYRIYKTMRGPASKQLPWRLKATLQVDRIHHKPPALSLYETAHLIREAIEQDVKRGWIVWKD